AMGYSAHQMADLEATINATPCDTVLFGTPVDLRRLLTLHVPAVRVSYDIEEIGAPTLEALVPCLAQKTRAQHGAPLPVRQETSPMHIRRHPMTLAPLLMLLTLCLHGQAGAGDTTPQQPLHTTMHAFFQALTSVFPWSLDAQRFQAPEQRQRIQAGLQALAQHAEYLDTHGQDVPQSVGFLRRSLARSAHDAAERYAQGEYPQARFLLQGLTENCFACHSRLPNLQPFDLGKRFLAATNVASLPVPQRLKLEVATRQFDMALTTCEALLRAPDIP